VIKNENQGNRLDKPQVVDYILSIVRQKVLRNEQDLSLICQAFNEKKNVRIDIETTFGKVNNVVIWIKEKRGLYRKLSL